MCIMYVRHPILCSKDVIIYVLFIVPNSTIMPHITKTRSQKQLLLGVLV